MCFFLEAGGIISYLHITCDIEFSLTYSLMSCNMSVKLAQLCFNGNVIVEAPWWWIFKKKILLEKCLKWSEMVRKVKTLTSEIFALYQVPLAKDLEKICKFFKNVFFALTRRHYFILTHNLRH